MIRAAVDPTWNIPYIVSRIDSSLSQAEFEYDNGFLVIKRDGVSQITLDAVIAAYNQTAADAWQEAIDIAFLEDSFERDVLLNALLKLFVSEVNKTRTTNGSPAYTDSQVKAFLRIELANARNVARTKPPRPSPPNTPKA